MKHFSWTRLISLLLVLVMCLGMAACGNQTNDDGDSDDSDKGGKEKTVSEATLFEDLKTAYEAFLEDTDTMSLKVTQSQTVKMPALEEDREVKVEILYSFDKGTQRYLTEESYDDGEYVSAETTKGFQKDGNFYRYDLYEGKDETEQDYTEEDYTQYYNADHYASEMDQDILGSLASMFGGVFLAEDFQELKDAFSETYPKLLENERNSLIEEGDISDDAFTSLKPTVTIEQKKDGTIVLTIVSKLEMSEVDSETKDLTVLMTRTIEAKDGALSAVSLSVKEAYQMLSDEESMEAVEIDLDMAFAWTYTFDEQAYNEVAVSLPTNPDDIYVKKPGVYVSLFGSRTDFRINMEQSTSEFLEFLSSALVAYYEDWDGSGASGSKYTISGFYKDEALTQPIDATADIKELIGLDTIYVSADIADGFASFCVDYVEESQISRNYQIVAFDGFYGAYGSPRDQLLYNAGETIYLSDYYYEGTESYKVLINGEETDAKTLVLESGKQYVVTFVTITQDKDLGLSHAIIAELY